MTLLEWKKLKKLKYADIYPLLDYSPTWIRQVFTGYSKPGRNMVGELMIITGLSFREIVGNQSG